jgi:hypothetical protein
MIAGEVSMVSERQERLEIHQSTVKFVEDEVRYKLTHPRKPLFILFVILVLSTLFLTILHPKEAQSAQATLSWNPPTTYTDGTPLTNLAGFNVYYGTASCSYLQVVNVGNVTAYTVTNLTDGVKYYFAVTAYDANGVESEYSNEASRTMGTSVDSNCAATLSSCLGAYIPVINFNGTYFWGYARCEVAADGSVMCRVISYGAAGPANVISCQASTLSADMNNLHIPFGIYNDVSYYADFENVPADRQMWFKLTNYAPK